MPLETMNKYNKVAGYTIYKNFAFQRLRKRNENSLIYNCNKNDKIPRSKLKEGKGPVLKITRHCLKGIEEDMKKWKDIPFS